MPNDKVRPLQYPQRWVQPARTGRWWYNSPRDDLWKLAIDLRRMPWYRLDKVKDYALPGFQTSSLSLALLLAYWQNPKAGLNPSRLLTTTDQSHYVCRKRIRVSIEPPSMLNPPFSDLEKSTIPALREVTEQDLTEYHRQHGYEINNEYLMHYDNGKKYLYFDGQLAFGGSRAKPAMDLVNERVGFYYGGPILNRVSGKWRRAHTTDDDGAILTARPRVPINLPQIIQATAVMSSKYMTQSALKVGDSIILSTLNFHHWLSDTPSAAEVQVICDRYEIFYIDSEVDPSPPSSRSAQAILVAYSIDDDLGIFKLLNPSKPHEHSVPLDWLMEREGPNWKQILSPGRRVGCIAYNAGTEDRFAEEIQCHTGRLLREQNLKSMTKLDLDLEAVAHPNQKTYSQGELDHVDAHDERITFGVSCSVWKGASGGPCVVLDGTAAGCVLGLGTSRILFVFQ
ncbi:MAG: hypothetical protein Q9215_007695 [Flavoplaca cf. flavocitrina]